MRNKRKDEKKSLLENISICGIMTFATLFCFNKLFEENIKNEDEDKKK